MILDNSICVPDVALALLPQMREWVMDCPWNDIESDEDVAALSDEEILRGVALFYDGGIDGFVRDAEPVPVAKPKPMHTQNCALCGVTISFSPESKMFACLDCNGLIQLVKAGAQ